MTDPVKRTRVTIVNKNPISRQVLSRGLAAKLDAQVVEYSCVEDLLLSSMDFDVFVVYSDLGNSNMSGSRGAREIKTRSPQAFVIGVSSRPDKEIAFRSAGADLFLLRAGNEIDELASFVRKFEHKQKAARA